ncbi:MAG: hypothetical protein LBD22_05835 [Spirochaetaceae bacterium]|jgi:hypothetical protein|nr:hypothetical protein [Spirochaetaceae bacterium]
MNKKIVVLAVLLCSAGAAKSYSLGLGLQYGGLFYYGSYTSNVSFLVSTSKDIHFAFNYLYTNYGGGIGLTGDYWVFDPVLTRVGQGALKLFAGVGFFFDTNFDFNNLHLGGRIPVGLDLKFPKFDIFLQMAPTWGLQFLPSPGLIGGSGFSGTGSIGARVWF